MNMVYLLFYWGSEAVKNAPLYFLFKARNILYNKLDLG
jgi:hypothetical protein